MDYVVIAAIVLIVPLAVTGLCVWADSALKTSFFAAIGFFTGVVAIIELCLVALAVIPIAAIYAFNLLDLLPGR